MKKRRKIKLKYKKDRVLLSDVLPYELPIIMSNRALYRFCVKNKIQYSIHNNCLHWDKKIDQASYGVLKMLFFPAFDKDHPCPSRSAGEAFLANYSTIPFVFHIMHKEAEFRSLSIVHPAIQMGIVDFYNRFKSLILHYCTRSNYSLRYPQKVASYFYYKDRLHHKLLGTKKDKIELFFNEYENLKTYFSYKKYTQIYRFYDDYRFQRAEKRFSHLLRFDIQKCFNSIYTHTIAWATQGGKVAYKKTFEGRDSSSFGGTFDTIMQRLNYNETSGIVIGPEFSRIFAEIILQHIDRGVEYELNHDGIINGTDYQLYRYVDDYFLFYNEERVRNRVVDFFNRNLEDYRLKISREKTIAYDRPFITEISRAKIRIDKLVTDWFKLRSSTFEEETIDLMDDKDQVAVDVDNEDKGFVLDLHKLNNFLNIDGYYPLVSRKFNQEFKDAILSVGVKAKDVLNYTLSCVSTRVERELRKFDIQYRYIKLASRCKNAEMNDELRSSCIDKLNTLDKKLARYLIDVIDSSFFLFSLNKRLNSTLKLSRLLNSIIIFLNGQIRCDGKFECIRFNKVIKQLVFGQMYNEVINVLRRSKCHDYAQLEVLYLLIVMRTIDSTHPIPEEILRENLCLNNNCIPYQLNSIAINVILYYIGNKSRYSELKKILIENVVKTIKCKNLPNFRKDTESILFVIDLACCPYVGAQQKKDIMTAMCLSDDEINSIFAFGKRNKYFFTKWSGVDVTKELDAKISQEVYS